MKLVFLLLALVALRAHGFGPDGHRIVGEIAQQFLTPRALQGVEYLLREDRLADRTPSGRKTLGEIAYWADEIKDVNWGKRLGSWHYDDIPVCEAPDPAQYCKTNCASKRLEEQIGLLRDRSQPPRRRNEALKWVVHLLGDIHQPLHAANNHDKGGNEVKVSFFGELDNPPYGPINLHAIWDVHILTRMLKERASHELLFSPIPETNRLAWQAGSIADWMTESHELAKSVVYGALPGGFACRSGRSGSHAALVALDEPYYAQAAPVLLQQVRKAGVRLARILNEALR